mgnify:CR=1 FL=1
MAKETKANVVEVKEQKHETKQVFGFMQTKVNLKPTKDGKGLYSAFRFKTSEKTEDGYNHEYMWMNIYVANVEKAQKYIEFLGNVKPGDRFVIDYYESEGEKEGHTFNNVVRMSSRNKRTTAVEVAESEIEVTAEAIAESLQ